MLLTLHASTYVQQEDDILGTGDPLDVPEGEVKVNQTVFLNNFKQQIFNEKNYFIYFLL